MLRFLVHNWQLKLLAVAIAMALWIFVVGQDKAEITIKVPVEVTNIPSQVVVVGDVTGEVSARIFGPRSLIRRVASENMAKEVSLAGMKPGEHIFHVLPEDLNLPPGVRVVRISPSSLTIALAKRYSRKVSVRPVIQGEPAPGMELGEVTFKPPKVTISGSEDELRDVDWVWTLPLDVKDLKTTTKITAALRPPPGRAVHLDRSKVEVTINIRPKHKEGAPPPAQKAPPAPASSGGTTPINP